MPLRRALLLTALIPGCAELRRPVVAAPPPPGLLPRDTDPGRAAVAYLAEDFRDAGAGITDAPARIARGAALLEWMAVEVADRPRWAALSRDVRERLGFARNEVRAALGADPLGSTPALATALATAHRALAAGDRGAAIAALGGSLFPRGAQLALLRLSDPGPLPQAEIGTGTLAEEVRMLDATGGWARDTIDPVVPAELGGLGGRPGF